MSSNDSDGKTVRPADDFLNAKPTLTPLVAGATTTTITGTLVTQFNLPGVWTAVGVAFALGLLTFFNRDLKQLGVKLMAYALNSVTIFSVAAGINSAAIAATTPAPKVPIERTVPAEGEQPFFQNWFEK